MEDVMAQYRSLYSPSYNVSTDTSKVNSPKTAIYSVVFQLTVSSLKVTRQPHTSSASSSHCLSFITLFQEAVPTEHVTNQGNLPSVYCIQDVPSFLDFVSYFFTLHAIGQQVYSIFFHYYTSYCPKYFLSTSRSIQVSAPIQVLFINSLEGLITTIKYARRPSWILLGHHRNGVQ